MANNSANTNLSDIKARQHTCLLNKEVFTSLNTQNHGISISLSSMTFYRTLTILDEISRQDPYYRSFQSTWSWLSWRSREVPQERPAAFHLNWAKDTMMLLTLFALWGVTFFTMTPNVTQSISSRFSVASLLFSWDSRMSFLLAIFLSISAEDTRGFLDPVKAGKRQHIHWHKWTIKKNQQFPGETTSSCKTPLCFASPWGHLK